MTEESAFDSRQRKIFS